MPPLRAGRWRRCTTRSSALGASGRAGREWGHLPVTVSGPARAGGDASQVRGDVSSQFITALMLIGPYLPGGLRIQLTTPLVSRAVRGDHRGGDGRRSASTASRSATTSIVRRRAVAYRARDYTIEPDASSASYPLAAAAIAGGTRRTSRA